MPNLRFGRTIGRRRSGLRMAKIAYFVRVWTFSCNLCNGFDYYLTASTHETQFRGLTLQ